MSARDSSKSDTMSTESDWQAYPKLDIPPILAAALEDFHQLGYHGTSVRNIAARSNLTMPTLYYHYGNKEGILYALLELAMDDLQRHIDLGLEDAGNDTFKGFTNLITSVALHYTHRRDLSMLHAEYRFLGPDCRAKYATRRRAVEDALEKLLVNGIAEGIFEDEEPRFTTRLLLGMVAGILDWYTPGGALPAEEIAARYTCRAVRIVSKVATA